MPIGNTNTHKQLMWKSSLINSDSFVYCKFYRVDSWNEGNIIILVGSSFQIPK